MNKQKVPDTLTFGERAKAVLNALINIADEDINEILFFSKV